MAASLALNSSLTLSLSCPICDNLPCLAPITEGSSDKKNLLTYIKKCENIMFRLKKVGAGLRCRPCEADYRPELLGLVILLMTISNFRMVSCGTDSSWFIALTLSRAIFASSALPAPSRIRSDV
jgi:hypothetical protein